MEVTAAFRLVGYDYAADAVDKLLRVAQSTVLESLDHFVDGVTEFFKKYCLREPHEDDLTCILQLSAELGCQ